jgi:probable H4MPT-linked C1 transfer pathway protein
MKVLTFDIGGANTKRLAFDSDTGEAFSEIFYFPFWRKKDDFSSFLSGLSEDADQVGITMTAELSDVFTSKEEGVQYIVDVCEDVFEGPLYLTLERTLVKGDEIKNPGDLAAANWLASTYYLEREFTEGLLIDCGSTTTDIIPFGKGMEYLRTDFERLKSGQLLYTGILRTPVSAIVGEVAIGNEMVPISSEYFAITADVYNVLRAIDEADYSCDTPDERGRSRSESMQRLSRLLCADFEEINEEAVLDMCNYVRDRQLEKIASCLEGQRERTAYICGAGKILASEACDRAGLESVDLSEITPAHDSLPCLGLAHMLADEQ